MDIDLFLTPHGECGLLCNDVFDDLPAGVIFDAETLELTVEFIEDAPFHLNIHVEVELQEQILFAKKLYIGFLENGMIAETIEVPLLYLNDPYGEKFEGNKTLMKPSRSMVAFEQFMERSTAAQPIHREDLGDENASGSVLKGMNPKQLEFVPQLIRQRMLEIAPQGPSGPSIPAPMGPMPTGPLGPGGAGTGASFRARPPKLPPKKPPKKSDDSD